LHPGRLPASSRRSLSDKKSFHLEAEGNCDGTACSPVRVAHWSPRAEQREKDDNERRPRNRETSAVQQHASLRRAATPRQAATRGRCIPVGSQPLWCGRFQIENLYHWRPKAIRPPGLPGCDPTCYVGAA
jgi:hypothetical protein